MKQLTSLRSIGPTWLVALAACAQAVPSDQDSQAVADGFAVATVSMVAGLENPSVKPVVRVWKSPNCGCCHGWVEHLRDNGYAVEVEDVADIEAVKRERAIPVDLQACHTALVDGYLVEGHVPADVVDRLLVERPAVAGIAVPGMPVGSPGMEVPGMPPQPYEVIAFSAGERRVFERR